MNPTFRVGFQIIPDDAFWVQVGIVIEQQARRLGIELVTLDIDNVELPNLDYKLVLEELMAQQLDSFLILEIPPSLLKLILAQNIPVISLASRLDCIEPACYHPGLVAPLGLYNVGKTMVNYLVGRLQGRGTVLTIGGLKGVGEDGRSILAGMYDTFAPYKEVQIYHIPTAWRYDLAYPQILAEMQRLNILPDAIFGLSDTLALAGRDAAAALDLLKPTSMVVGSNGDPLALAAIAEGKMEATVELATVDFGTQVVQLAWQAALGQPLSPHFNFKLRLITGANITEVAAQKLIAIAELPNHLIGVNRQREQQRMTQLETSLAISRQTGAILDHQELTQTIVNLIRTRYGYDRVRLYLWSEASRTLTLDGADTPGVSRQEISPDDDSLLTQVLETGELIFVPDVRYSQRFKTLYDHSPLRSRLVLPLRLGQQTLGLLDLQHDYLNYYNREQLISLQLLADQLAVTIRNAELYSEALTARRVAEKADGLKTRLLANVSHELRTPLNVILGYTKSALSLPNPYAQELPRELITDLGRVYDSGEHLTRLINDLLDLSRAEIDELKIHRQVIDTRPFLAEVFNTLAGSANEPGPVEWQFVAPSHLPLLQADPLRLRQILLNLLSNAQKFTQHGQIILGVEVQPPYVHIWVADTGSGISPEQRDQIFEPFIVGGNTERHSGGIGLGLAITRHLVTLHQGLITVESQPTKGSTFHVYLPLPNLSGELLVLSPVSQSELNLVCISNNAQLPPEIKLLGRQNNIRLYGLRPAQLRERLVELEPSILAWDTTSAELDDWAVMDYLRSTPHLARLPLILYGNNLSENLTRQVGTTNIVLKPFNGQTLQMLLEALRSDRRRDGALIVDDDVQSLDLYQQLVKSALPDLAIHRAENGRRALLLLKEFVPDLVIIDLIMPEVDGYEVIKWLRTNPPTRNVPIIVVSGKVLSTEQIERLDFARVLLHTKDILRSDETIDVLQGALDGKVFLSQYSSLLVKRAVTYLQQNYARSLSLQKIAQEIGISKNYLVKNFHQELGISPWEYLNRYRIREAKRLLETTNLSITEVAAQIGFDDPAYFSRTFRTHTGQSPKQYRNTSIA